MKGCWINTEQFLKCEKEDLCSQGAIKGNGLGISYKRKEVRELGEMGNGRYS